MIGLEIGRRNYLAYLLLPHRAKTTLLPEDSRRRLDRINRGANETIDSGEDATSYDRAHRYDEAEPHEYPARLHWAGVLAVEALRR